MRKFKLLHTLKKLIIFLCILCKPEVHHICYAGVLGWLCVLQKLSYYSRYNHVNAQADHIFTKILFVQELMCEKVPVISQSIIPNRDKNIAML
jgi:hypothetical protein